MGTGLKFAGFVSILPQKTVIITINYNYSVTENTSLRNVGGKKIKILIQ